MIAFVRGEVAAVTLNSAVLEVGGVGLELMCTPGTLATLRVGRQAMLPTSMVVREDSLTVFGFLDDDEKQVFEIAQTASGVGPKVAQAIVAVMSPDDVRRAITHRGRQGAHPRAGHRPEGRAADHPRAQGPHRPAARRPPRPPLGPPPRRGATRCTRAWSGWAGRPRSPSRRSRRSRPTPATRPTSALCCARPSHAEQGLRDAMDWDDTDVDDDARRSTRPSSPTCSGSPTPTPTVTTAPSRRRCARARSTRSSGRYAYATSSGWSSKPPAAVAARPTTSCCPVLPASARPRWR